jgi:hypothetical protein
MQLDPIGQFESEACSPAACQLVTPGEYQRDSYGNAVGNREIVENPFVIAMLAREAQAQS